MKNLIEMIILNDTDVLIMEAGVGWTQLLWPQSVKRKQLPWRNDDNQKSVWSSYLNKEMITFVFSQFMWWKGKHSRLFLKKVVSAANILTENAHMKTMRQTYYLRNKK